MLLFLIAALTEPVANELVALDRRIQTAMVQNQTSVLSRSIADNFRFTHDDGFVETKADVLRSASLMPRYYLRRVVLKSVAEAYGNFGLVIGSLDVASGPAAGDPPETRAACYTLNYVHVYVKRVGRWQLLSHRTTEMTRLPRACAPAS